RPARDGRTQNAEKRVLALPPPACAPSGSHRQGKHPLQKPFGSPESLCSFYCGTGLKSHSSPRSTPFFNLATWSDCCAISVECVTTMTHLSKRCASSLKMPTISFSVSSSRFPVG